jgi:transcription-repair coupling factor (superfamily II helicase)
VEDENWRMMIYKKIARAGDEKALGETLAEIADRFGPPPPAVKRLAAYARIRHRAESLGIHAVTAQAGRVHLRLAEDAAVDPDRLLRLVQSTPGASLTPARVLSLPAPRGEELPAVLLAWLERLAGRPAA